MQCAGSLQSGGLPNAIGPERRLRVPPIEERAVGRQVDDEVGGARVERRRATACTGRCRAARRARRGSARRSRVRSRAAAPRRSGGRTSRRDSRARCPGSHHGACAASARRHRIPVAERTERHALRDRGQAGLVREQPAHRECRPCPRRRTPASTRATGASRSTSPRATAHIVAIATTPLVHENTHTMRVALPRPRPRRVEVPAPEVDDVAAVDADRQRRAELEPVGEVLRERVAHGRERRIARSPCGSRAHSTSVACGIVELAPVRDLAVTEAQHADVAVAVRVAVARRRPRRCGTPRSSSSGSRHSCTSSSSSVNELNSLNVMSCIWFHGSSPSIGFGRKSGP